MCAGLGGEPALLGVAMVRETRTSAFWRGALPHWEVVDGRYFVTLHLANSLPSVVAEKLRQELAAQEGDPQVRSQAYFRQLDYWLDAHHGDVHLKHPAVAAWVVDTIKQYQRAGYWQVLAYAVLPNHLHLFFRCGILTLSDVMKRFKRCTAREANRLLAARGERFWQREWFDHWSRSTQEDDKIIAYIRNNPMRAGLIRQAETWPWVWTLNQ